MLKQRMQFSVLAVKNGKVKLLGGAPARALAKQYSFTSLGPKKGKQLSGMPACVGKVKGKVRVIVRDSEFQEFKKGEILVAIQTMVHYLPIMKKAKAILTEFGGLTSHAAIVSRELNTPCVVGISGLINTLKTGDQIEIDANKGTIKLV